MNYYKEIEAKLRDFFAMQDIKLAFLIGSYAMGTARPDSDVDIAVLFGRRFLGASSRAKVFGTFQAWSIATTVSPS